MTVRGRSRLASGGAVYLVARPALLVQVSGAHWRPGTLLTLGRALESIAAPY
jgi:hypothetical protein